MAEEARRQSGDRKPRPLFRAGRGEVSMAGRDGCERYLAVCATFNHSPTSTPGSHEIVFHFCEGGWASVEDLPAAVFKRTSNHRLSRPKRRLLEFRYRTIDREAALVWIRNPTSRTWSRVRVGYSQRCP